MTEDKVQLFKLQLKALPLLEQRRQRLRVKYDQIEYTLQNVRGVDPSKEPSAPGNDIRLELIEQKDELEAQIDLIGAQIERTRIMLDLFSEGMQKILTSIYCNGVPTVTIAEKLGYSESTLRRLINKKIANTLN